MMRRLFCRHKLEADLGLPVKVRGRRRMLFAKLCFACSRLRVVLPENEAETMQAAEAVGEKPPATSKRRGRRRRR